MTASENRRPSTKSYRALARPEYLQTQDQVDAFFAAAMGITVEELRQDWYDPKEPELSDEEINRLLD